MEWFIIVTMILFGLGLIIIEIIFVPGTTIVGIAGLIIGGYGIYRCYDVFGTTAGNIVLTIALLVSLAALIAAFKSNSWDRFSLKDMNNSKVNDELKQELSIGQHGKTVSSVRPIGKAMFDDIILEVRSKGDYISENQAIEITKIDGNKIYIEALNKIT